eukprot:COSAG01_NODE_22880_length_837_cov_1.012195_1_plen_87_part_00
MAYSCFQTKCERAKTNTTKWRFSFPSMQGILQWGLHKLNYTYFIVDEPCFAGRDADGVLIENKTTWPHGLKAFGQELRSRSGWWST